ncbi:hypothetical protein IAU60_001852 [Kwoniella sp. DSM 27419]
MSYPFSSSSGSPSSSRCSTPATSMPGTPSMSPSPAMSYASVDSLDSASTHGRRTRHGGAGFWTSLRHHSKSLAREEPEDEMMQIDTPIDPISLTPPPSRPICSLTASYQCSETSSLIPPSFYPGQSIPVVLTFELDRFSSLPHYLNPTLTMSLIGSLHLPDAEPRTIICVSVSLSEGLALWARDAQQTYARNPPKPSECSIDPTHGLPGGTYSLPLTVQVPSTPRLPPSFMVSSSTFAVTYALTVTLSCDDPALPGTGSRVVLTDTARPFEMMPETLPTRAPRYVAQSFYVKSDLPASSSQLQVEMNGATSHKHSTKWTVHPYIPTTAYSPTSMIPFSLTLTPPSTPTPMLAMEDLFLSPGQVIPQARYQILIRLALIRREHSSLSQREPRDAAGHGLVSEQEIISRWGWIESNSPGKIKLRDVTLPLMSRGVSTWKHGMSTMLNVGPAANGGEEGISVSSTFLLNVSLAFLPLSPGSPVLGDYLSAALSTRCSHGTPSAESALVIPPVGVFTEPTAPGDADHFDMAAFKRCFPGTTKTLPLPIVVGSVSEPRGAMHAVRWSDLHLERHNGTETGRMIHGEGVTSENGWIMPPPSYHEALKAVPYEYKV